MFTSKLSRRLLKLVLLPGLVFGWWTWGPYPEHENLTGKAIDIAIQRWPEMSSELNAYRSQIVQGSHDEDFGEDTLYGSSSDYSGYSPSVPAAWWPTAQLRLNAQQWIRAWQNPYSWDAALNLYSSNPAAAYLSLGHVIHNLEDLFVPAHSFIAPHGLGTSGLVENHSWPLYFDNFEQYCEVTANELNRADPNRIPEARSSPETLMIQAALFATTDQESLSYYPNQYYAPPAYAGDWGKYRPYPSGGYPCGRDQIDNSLANAWSLFIVPRCVEHTAALIRLYWELTHTALEEVGSQVNVMRFAVSPNPFRTMTELHLPRTTGDFRLILRDVTGKVIRSWKTGSNHAGRIVWDGTDEDGKAVPTGIYYAEYRCPGQCLKATIIRY